jgi:uncharacterized protein YfkK (UPF0435 family)
MIEMRLKQKNENEIRDIHKIVKKPKRILKGLEG